MCPLFLEDMGVESFILDKTTTNEEVEDIYQNFEKTLEQGKCVAFIVRKGALSYDEKVTYCNEYSMKREDIIEFMETMSVSGLTAKNLSTVIPESIHLIKSSKSLRGRLHRKIIHKDEESESILLALLFNQKQPYFPT